MRVLLGRMRGRQAKKNVATWQYKRLGEKGFTLLEMLISLCFLSVLLLITPRLQPLFYDLPRQHDFNRFEWTIFLEQAQMEYRQVKEVEIVDTRLHLKDRNQIPITYVRAGTQLVRKVNGSGNEILLQNVKAVSYEQSLHTLTVSVEDLAGTVHKGILTRFSLEGEA